MFHTFAKLWLVSTLLCTVVIKPAAAQVITEQDPILYWNEVILTVVANDHSDAFLPGDQFGPTKTSRALAIYHVALYDAANSVRPTYASFNTSVTVTGVSSIHAAVATAAYTILQSLYPHHVYVTDTYTTYLATITNGSSKNNGVLIGTSVAQTALQKRTNDNANADMMYTPSNEPGKHRVDPLNPDQPYLTPKWGAVTPFVLQTIASFRAPVPPTLQSAEYAVAYNEVKRIGGDGIITPSTRTAEQEEIGYFWAYDASNNIGVPPRMYNNIARTIAIQKQNTVMQNARFFALVNLAQADAGIAAWDSKYYYNYWRPIVAIREADSGTGPTGLGDQNNLTTGNEHWTPLGSPASNSTTQRDFTPPFPAYPSGHAAFGAAAMHMIALFYGTDAIAFTQTSDEMNGITTGNDGIVRPYKPRSYTTLTQAITENAMSRIYLGIHWNFDATAGNKMGTDIADYVFNNALLPLENSSSSISSSSSSTSSSSSSSTSSSTSSATSSSSTIRQNNVEITIHDSKNTVLRDEEFTYTVTVSNPLTVPVAVAIRIEYSTELKISQVSKSGFSMQSNSINWPTMALAAGSLERITLRAVVKKSSHTNDVQLTVIANNRSETEHTFIAQASSTSSTTSSNQSTAYNQLIINRHANRTEVQPGSPVEFTVEVFNPTSVAITNIKIHEVMPLHEAQLLQSSVPLNLPDGVLWTINNLPAGQTAYLRYILIAKPTVAHGEVLHAATELMGPNNTMIQSLYTNVPVLQFLPQTGQKSTYLAGNTTYLQVAATKTVSNTGHKKLWFTYVLSVIFVGCITTATRRHNRACRIL